MKLLIVILLATLIVVILAVNIPLNRNCAMMPTELGVKVCLMEQEKNNPPKGQAKTG